MLIADEVKGGGTTTWRLAHHLLDVADLTVVTNSMQVANVLYRSARADLTDGLPSEARTVRGEHIAQVTIAPVRRRGTVVSR